MREIEFNASFGDEQKRVVIGQDVGGGEGWHVLIDNYSRGVIYYRQGQWVYYDRHLELDDVMVIAELIEEYLSTNGCDLE